MESNLEAHTTRFIDEIRNHFSYDDGKLFRNGAEVGWFDKGCSYFRVRFKNKSYLLHRLIYAYHYGYLPKFIDHIDRDKTNNRIKNLRGTEKKQNNTVNSVARSDNTSGYKGVTWHKSSKKWHSSIFKDGKRHYLGVFNDIKEAAKIYNDKARELFGEFAFLNEIGET